MIGDIPDGYTVNIEKVLDNNKVYTAVINGYPYKTPSELGVYNKYDAFMATKQAVYSVLYNYNVDSHYRGVDERGDNIKKAIKTKKIIEYGGFLLWVQLKLVEMAKAQYSKEKEMISLIQL